MEKKKKPVSRRWWFWLIVALAIVTVFTSGGAMLIIYIPILTVVFFILWLRERKTSKKDSELTATLSASLYAANQRLNELEKYQAIADVEQECKNLRELADIEVSSIKAAAQADRTAASKARSDAEAAAARIVSHAKDEAAQIVSKADEEAHKIAGDAYEAKQKAAEYEATVVALKNVISGYGDQWMKPAYSLLDELAEDFGYDEAGQKLAQARKNSVLMMNAREAADCNYVEKPRRATAINFVVDAFNGKVDSILLKVKKDNYGKLEQQIKDAYHLVNMNGRAFQNARIVPQYLEARLEELKWAVICQELKAQKQEEQRRIREQMREEEKARREYERAQKEAAQEEAMLRKAMEKAQAAMEQASAEQRAEYEAQLAELQQKLTEAEEKNQRAISMAQQTKRGNVYVISNIGSFGENVYKVGMTRRLDPMDRVKELGDASVPFPFDVHAIIESDDAPSLETSLHKALALMQVNKVNPRKEFFRVNLSDIHKLVDNMGLTASWTMEAAAAEYRETLTIEENMKNDPEAKRRWEEYNASLTGSDIDEESEIA